MYIGKQLLLTSIPFFEQQSELIGVPILWYPSGVHPDIDTSDGANDDCCDDCGDACFRDDCCDGATVCILVGIILVTSVTPVLNNDFTSLYNSINISFRILIKGFLLPIIEFKNNFNKNLST